MRLTDASINIQGTLPSAWDKLTNWRAMQEWDPFMERLQFDGPIKEGVVGQLKLKGGPQVALVVTKFEPPHTYTNEFSMLGSTFTFYHELKQMPSRMVALRIWVEGQGIVAQLLAPYLHKSFATKMPTLMHNFKQQYEQQNPM